MNRYLTLLLLLSAGPVTAADYFRCNGLDGLVMSDIPCPHITHTRMRSLDIDEKIARGMTRDQVRDS